MCALCCINKMATEYEYFTALEKRISALERKLIGEEKVREGQPSLIHLINTINGKLEAMAISSPIIKEVWVHTSKIEECLQYSGSARARLDLKAKEELVLTYTDQLVKIQHQLEDIETLKESINAPAFRGLDKENQQVAELSKKHVSYEQELESLANQIQAFVSSYTKVLLKLSQEGVEWNDKLTSMN